MSEVEQMEKSYEGATREHAGRVRSLVKRMRSVSPEKRLATIPSNWRSMCAQLMLDFPNFVDVIKFIRYQFALSNKSNKILHLPPFLLLGEPGIGKTEFLLTLTQQLNTSLDVIDVASLQSESTLAGSESFWGNTKPGNIFNKLVFADVANPIIMLDEIDKARNDNIHNPLSALFSLLEPRQAKAFKDLSVPEINLDASHIIWCATANERESISTPIVNRLVAFSIKKPDRKQMQVIVKNLYQQFTVNQSWGVYFDKVISEEVVAELCRHPPRKVRKILEQAFGHAAYENRNHITIEGVQAVISNEVSTTPMGFIN